MTDPQRREGDPKVTAAGRIERRRHERRMHQRRRDEQDREPFTWGAHRRYVRRATLAFVALTIISCVAAWLSYDSGRDSRRGVAANAARAAYETCVSGGELRLATAKGLDDLRSLAITAEVPARIKLRFISRTQPSIDRLLTQAAYGTGDEAQGRVFHAPIPPGTVTPAVVERVRDLSVKRCIARAGRTFDATAAAAP